MSGKAGGRAPAQVQASWRAELFGSPSRSVLSVALFALLLWIVIQAGQWALVNALFRPDAQACHQARGACWGVIAEKWRAMLFGRYPYGEQWRAALALGAVFAATAVSAWPRMWRPALGWVWLAVVVHFLTLMHGGVLGLTSVATNLWGGLPLTVSLAAACLTLAFPIAVALALARRSRWPAVRSLAVIYIELVRGVPLISVLFMATFLLPLLWPMQWRPDVLMRVVVGMTLFVAAYFAEIIRGGLQAVPLGQIQAAQALGMGAWRLQRHIVLPQALRMVIPALMNSVIGTLKDTSLVTVVGLFELTGALGMALGGDPTWRPFYLEGYLFIAVIYWLMCFGLSRYSLFIERRLAQGSLGLQNGQVLQSP